MHQRIPKRQGGPAGHTARRGLMPLMISVSLILVVLILQAVTLGGCTARVPSRLTPPKSGIQDMVGLALAEEVYLNFKRQAMVKLAPALGSSSIYRGKILPQGTELIFKQQRPGQLYLAWVPASRLLLGEGKPVVILTGHEIKSRAGVFRTTWPQRQAPVISSRFQAGRVTYLGLVKRRLYPLPRTFEPEKERSVFQKSPPSRIELTYSPDMEGWGLMTAWHDSPWLKAILLNPPPGLKNHTGEKQKP